MPWRPSRYCAAGVCGRRVPADRTYCDVHKRERPSSSARGYGHEHRQRREGLIRAHPVCQCRRCSSCNGIPCTRPSTDLDHVNGDAWDNRPGNHQMLCKQCHGAKTAKVPPVYRAPGYRPPRARTLGQQIADEGLTP